MKKILLLIAGVTAFVADGFSQMIVVREEQGLSYMPTDNIYFLRYNEPPQLYIDESHPDTFSLSYREGAFIVTALKDNNLAEFSLPFVLLAYPEGEEMRSYNYPDSNVLGGLSMLDFPMRAGEEYRTPIPTILPAVPEPATWGWMGGAVLLAALSARR